MVHSRSGGRGWPVAGGGLEGEGGSGGIWVEIQTVY